MIVIRGMRNDNLLARIGNALRLARKQRGHTMAQVASAVGVATSAVQQWETGKTMPSSANLIRASEFLKIDPIALQRGGVELQTTEQEPNDAEIVASPAPPIEGPVDIPILGTMVGGEDGDFSMNGEVTGYVRRPPGIASVKNVHALHVLGDSMSPKYEPGDLVYCGGREPVPGDDIVVEMEPDEGETAGKAYIKRLVRRNAGEIVCRQFNPAIEVTFNRYAVRKIFRVIPLRELLGY